MTIQDEPEYGILQGPPTSVRPGTIIAERDGAKITAYRTYMLTMVRFEGRATFHAYDPFERVPRMGTRVMFRRYDDSTTAKEWGVPPAARSSGVTVTDTPQLVKNRNRVRLVVTPARLYY